jgi:hypothetical protein
MILLFSEVVFPLATVGLKAKQYPDKRTILLELPSGRNSRNGVERVRIPLPYVLAWLRGAAADQFDNHTEGHQARHQHRVACRSFPGWSAAFWETNPEVHAGQQRIPW